MTECTVHLRNVLQQQRLAKNTCLSHQSKNDLVDPAPAASRASGPPTVAGSSVLVLLELTLGSNSLRSSPIILCSGMNEQRLTGQGYEPLEPRRKDKDRFCALPARATITRESIFTYNYH
jgi:hypothetical protein